MEEEKVMFLSQKQYISMKNQKDGGYQEIQSFNVPVNL